MLWSTLRQLLASLITLYIAGYLLNIILHGLRHGRIVYNSVHGRRWCHRRKQPWLFWFLVALFGFFAINTLALWWLHIGRNGPG